MKRLFSLTLAIVLFFSVLPVSTFAAIDQNELEEYLVELNWTEDELVEYLDSYYGYTLADFETVADLKDLFGPLVTEENLQQLLTDFELTLEELEALLAEFGESIEDYLFIEDLEAAVEFYLDYDEFDYEDIDYEDMGFDIFAEFGLTEAEMEKLLEHLTSLDFENPEFEARLMELTDRLMAFEEIAEFESAEELTAEQIAELASIFSELLNLFELEGKFYFVKGDEKKPVSLLSLMGLTTSNGYNLLIEFYNMQGEFLADILLTADLFGSELIADTGSDLEKVIEVVKEKEEVKPVKTEKGAKLPNTGSNYLQNTLLGLITALAGVFVFRKFNVRGNE